MTIPLPILAIGAGGIITAALIMSAYLLVALLVGRWLKRHVR